MSIPLYPLKFVPLYIPKAWGGRTLEQFGRTLPNGSPIGESWELSDLESCPLDRGGHLPARSVVSHGPLAGKTLHELIGMYGPRLLGDVPLNVHGEFPLLIKLIDAHQNLSVQVHPDQAYAAAHPGVRYKNECWYILRANPGSVIYKGLRPGLDREGFRRAIHSGQVKNWLIPHPVQPGQSHYIPAGTCHSIGAGVLLAEIQTPSQETFRIFDWDRSDRPMHVEAALRCTRLDSPADPEGAAAGDGRRVSPFPTQFLHNGLDFELTVGHAAPSRQVTVDLAGQLQAWLFLSGRGLIGPGPAGCHEAVPFQPLQTVLFPASLAPFTLQLDAPSQWLTVTIPPSR